MIELEEIKHNDEDGKDENDKNGSGLPMMIVVVTGGCSM